MQHKLTVTTEELVIIRESINVITIKGKDAPIVGGLLDKINKGIDTAIAAETKTGESVNAPKK